MGGQLSLLAQTAPSIAIFSYIDILDETHYVTQLNNSRFLKTCKALDPNGEIVIKVFIKPKEDSSLNNVISKLKSEAILLSTLPNVLNYSKIFETNRAGYLVRQHLKTNLYDRLNSRPYFTDIESRFVAFQLLNALNDIHALNIKHGDIKTENILLTTSNWVILSDFSAHIKPAYVPEDNPGEFSFYFDTSKRRACYLAPEKFDSVLAASRTKKHNITKEMDIFSMGCCIAELFTEERPIFSLSQLFKYKNGSNSLDDILQQLNLKKIPILSELLCDMLAIDPQQRLPASELLQKYRGTLFPDYFYTFLYDYFKTLINLETSIPFTEDIEVKSTLQDKLGVIDRNLMKVYNDFSKICNALNFPVLKNEDIRTDTSDEYIHISNEYLLLCRYDENEQIPAIKDGVAVLFLNFVSQGVRNLISVESRIKSLQLLTGFSLFVSDEIKLDRVIPFVVFLFEDSSSRVRCVAIKALSDMLKEVRKLNDLNENIFVDYLLPRILQLLQNSKDDRLVRMTLAANISDFAHKANLFQEFSFFDQKTNMPDLLQDFESTEILKKYSRKLTQTFEDITVRLLTDNDACVKIALLNNILPLCSFFGREKTNDIILSHLITYLNDKDPALRMFLVQCISGIAILLGPITMEQYILPLLIQTLTDTEEIIVVSVLKNLKDLIKTGFVAKSYFHDITQIVAPLVLHPNNWIREFALLTIADLIKQLSKAEIYCILYPILRPYFDFDIEFSTDMILSSSKTPVTRVIYNLLSSWYLRSKKSFFWQRVPSNSIDSFGNSAVAFVDKKYVKENYGLNSIKNETKLDIRTNENETVPLTIEDKFWIDKFRNIGLKEAEMWKIVALREYVVRTTRSNSKKRENSNSFQNTEAVKTISLNDNMMPNTIFFDIEFLDSETPSLNDSNVSNGYESIQTSEKRTNNHSKVIEMKGSLIFKNNPMPTTVSSFKNVYVQLEPTNNHHEGQNHLTMREQKPPKFTVRSSYEGNKKTVQEYVRTLHVFPSLREYKEFGFVAEDIDNKIDIEDFKGNFVMSYPQSYNYSIVSSDILLGSKVFVVYGADQGTLSVWDISGVSSEKLKIEPLTYECSAEITSVKSLGGFDSFCVALKSGQLLVLRVSYQGEVSFKSDSQIICIRKAQVSQNPSEFITHIEYDTLGETFQIIALTNFSNILLYDIRTMELIKKIEISPKLGSCTTIAVDTKNMLLFIGSVAGVIEMWDLRFFVKIRTWTFGSSLPISQLKIITLEGINYLLVCGGISSTFFTIWNITKQTCKHVFVKSDEQPSIESFNTIDFQEDKVDNNFEHYKIDNPIIHIVKDRVFYTDCSSRRLYILDVRNPGKSLLFCGNEISSYPFSTTKVTTSLTLSLPRKSADSLEQENNLLASRRIIAIKTVKLESRNFLLVTDDSGYINVYS
ncbi:Serine/threonine-protein kinase VPS15 [Nakaseomyces bracarensis]|uniref:non-specific serine/threonine protein kinase n=1 Tax=Nakaseomyces bracarensis TaxID=273131 RepID=A0ABR4P039_9SACH